MTTELISIGMVATRLGRRPATLRQDFDRVGIVPPVKLNGVDYYAAGDVDELARREATIAEFAANATAAAAARRTKEPTMTNEDAGAALAAEPVRLRLHLHPRRLPSEALHELLETIDVLANEAPRFGRELRDMLIAERTRREQDDPELHEPGIATLDVYAYGPADLREAATNGLTFVPLLRSEAARKFVAHAVAGVVGVVLKHAGYL